MGNGLLGEYFFNKLAYKQIQSSEFKLRKRRKCNSSLLNMCFRIFCISYKLLGQTELVFKLINNILILPLIELIKKPRFLYNKPLALRLNIVRLLLLIKMKILSGS